MTTRKPLNASVLIIGSILALAAIVSIANSYTMAQNTALAINARQGHPTGYVEQAIGTGRYRATQYTRIAYQPTMCLLPTSEEGYLEQFPTICINTGKVASDDDLAAMIFADLCVPGGYVPCAPIRKGPPSGPAYSTQASQQGWYGGTVDHLLQNGTFAPALYDEHMCLIGAPDVGYIPSGPDGQPERCVNTGRLATYADLNAGYYAKACVPGGFVGCLGDPKP